MCEVCHRNEGRRAPQHKRYTKQAPRYWPPPARLESRLPAQIGHQLALGMRGEFAASEQPEGRGLMLEQGPAAPVIEGPD